MSQEQNIVLYLLDDFHIGGITSSVRQYTISAHQKGFKTIIIGMSGDMSNPQKFFPYSTVVIIPKKRGGSFIERLKDAFIYTNYLRNIFKSNSIQTVHFSHIWSTLYVLLLPTAWHSKKIMSIHGIYAMEVKSQNSGTGMMSSLKFQLRLKIQSILSSLCTYVIVFSEYEKKLVLKHLTKISVSSIRIIPGTIKNEDIVKKRFVRSKKTFSILFIGRAEPRKGIRILLQAASMLKNKNIRFELTIASPVDYYRTFDTLKSFEEFNLFTSIRFLHAVDDVQKNVLLKDADVTIVPSLDLETFGLILIESMAKGVPVIGFNTGAIPEILNLVDPRLITEAISAQALAKKIIWYDALPRSEKLRLSKKCNTICKTHFSNDIYADALISLYRK